MGTTGDVLSLFDAAPGPSRRGQPETAAAAGRSVAGITGDQKRSVLMALYAAGEYGATAYELFVRCENIDYPHVASTRRDELGKRGWAVPTERRRATNTGRLAVVWVLTDEGCRVAAEVARTW